MNKRRSSGVGRGQFLYTVNRRAVRGFPSIRHAAIREWNAASKGGTAVYPVAADKYFGPLPSPLRGVNQRVINARSGFSEPRIALVASSGTPLPRVIPRSVEP